MRRLTVVVAVALAAGAACTQAGPGAMPADQAAIQPPDQMDVLLLASAKIALPPPGFTAAELPDPESRGAKLMAENCTQCHDLPTPGAHSATDWPRVLARMWLRSDELPESYGIKRLAEGERTLVADYLMANALKVTDAALPAGPGKAEYEAMCSRCHALPDLRTHSAQDWPAVYRRMERNMERMNVRKPTQDQSNRILLYLQEAGNLK